MEGLITHDFEQLWTDTYPELLRYYERRLPNPADAEDTIQILFEQLLRREGVRTPEALLRTIASRLLDQAYRDKAETPTTLSWDQLIGDGQGLDHLPQFQTWDFDDAEFAGGHDVAVRDLEDELRDAYILGELRGLPSREAGPLLGVSHATANTRRELATTTLREELSA